MKRPVVLYSRANSICNCISRKNFNQHYYTPDKKTTTTESVQHDQSFKISKSG